MGQRLVDDWKTAYKWLSVQLTVLLGVATGLYENLTVLQGVVSPTMFHYAQLIGVGGIIAGRLYKQAAKDSEVATEEKKE